MPLSKVATVAFALFASLASRAAAAPPDSLVVCGSPEPIPVEAFLNSSDSTVISRIVFIAYPGNDSLQLPVWADNLRDELQDYFFDMSRGAQTFAFQIVKRTDDSTLAWLAPDSAIVYSRLGGAYRHGPPNTDVMQAIADSIEDVWDGVELVVTVHYQCIFDLDDECTTDACLEAECLYVGLSGLNLRDDVEGFSGVGVTTRLMFWPDVNSIFIRESAKYMAAHEVGHLLDFEHSRGSQRDTGDVNFVNPGRYDIMRAGASGGVTGQGLIPFMPLHSHTQDSTNWTPRISSMRPGTRSMLT